MNKIFPFLFLFFFHIANGQSGSNESDFFKKSIQNAIEIYHQSRNVEAELYNGLEYLGYLPTIQGIAYYRTFDWQKGSVVYNNILYEDVFLKYDMVKDELLVKHPNNFSVISLFSPRVQEFSLGENEFRFVHKTENSPLQPGFYEEIAVGKITVLAKKSKKIYEKITGTQIERQFVDSYQFYALMDGKVYPIKKENSILNLTKDKKKEVQQHLKNSGIRYRTNPELAITAIALYYNQLSN